MAVDVLTRSAELDAIAPEWNRLADLVEAQPFGRPGMAVPWWNHLGRGDLRVVTVRSGGGDLIGLAPFHRRSFGRLSVVRPLGHGVGAISSYLVAPVKGDVAGLLTAGLLDDATAIHAVDVPLADPGLAAARRQDGLSVHAVLHDQCPVIELGAPESRLLDGPSHASLRKLLARVDRDLGSRSIEVRSARSPDEVAAAIGPLMAVYDVAEDAHPRLHLGQDPFRPFFFDALARLAADGRLVILTLWIDDEPAAFDLYVTSGRVAHAILGRFDPRFADRSPGHLLLRAAVESAGVDGFERIDLQLGADSYKTRWATTSYDTLDTLIAPTSDLPRARALVSGVELAFGARAGVRSFVGRVAEVRSGNSTR